MTNLLRCVIATFLVATLSNTLVPPSSGGSLDFSQVEVITFDFYAALMDTLASLKENAAPIMAKDENAQHMTRKQIDDFVGAWAKQYSGYVGVVNALQHNEVLEWGDKDLFKVMLNITLDYACKVNHMMLRQATKEALVDSWKHLKPWQNTATMLRALHAARTKDGQRRFHIAALSNADLEFLRDGCVDLETKAGITFDAYLGCDGLGVGGVCLFKPEPAFYNQTKSLVKADDDGSWKHKVLHVAGAQYDANGAKAFGLRVIWNANSTNPVFFDYTGTGKNVPDAILHEIGELPGVLGVPDIPELIVKQGFSKTSDSEFFI